MNSSNHFIWTKLHLPAPITVDTARAAIASLAGLSGQPRLVLEATGRDGQVSWKLGCPARRLSPVIRALGAQIPGLRTEGSTSTFDGLRADVAAAIRLRGEHTEPLNHSATEPTVRGVFGSLASTRKAELLHLQLILGPRARPTFPTSGANRRTATTKLKEHRFLCEVRIAAATKDLFRSRSLINGIVGALRQLEAPGVRIDVVRASAWAFSEAKRPLWWPSSMSVSDLVPLTGWPVASKTAERLPGVPSSHPQLLLPSDAVAKKGRVVGVSTAAVQRDIAFSVEDSLRHLHIVGPTGVGKSTLMAHLALQDIAAGRGLVVVDPKGDLVDHILARADEHRLHDIVVLDARDDMPVGLNPLGRVDDPDLTADVLLSLFRSLYGEGWLPRTHELLQACLLTLARRGDASIAMVPLFLTTRASAVRWSGRQAGAIHWGWAPTGAGTTTSPKPSDSRPPHH